MVDSRLRKVDYILAVFLCMVFFSGKIHAQTGSEDYLVVNRLTRENGLPDQDVNGIYFDSRGYAWISTFGGGLVRFDGDSFIKFSEKNGSISVGDIVSQCREDRFGRLWVPGAGGLDILDLKTLSLMGDIPGISKAWRRSHPAAALRRDSMGFIWFTSNDMLFRVAFSDDGNRVLVDSLKCNVSNDNLMPKACDVENDGSVWITLNGYFFKVRQIEGKGLHVTKVLPDMFIGDDNRATAYQRIGNDVWIGTQKGLYMVDIASGSYQWESTFENGFWTYSMEEAETGLKATLRDLTENLERDVNVCCMGLSGMMHGYLAFDRNWGLLVPFRTWQPDTMVG